MTAVHSPVIDVHLILLDGDKILLSQRGANAPINREPEKCLQLEWFTVHDLPDDLIPYPAAGLRGYLAGDLGVTIHGWAGVPGHA
jgi:hypothetical protein